MEDNFIDNMNSIKIFLTQIPITETKKKKIKLE